MRFALFALLAFAPAAAAQAPDPAILTVDRIFAGDEFRGDRFAAPKWLDGAAYTALIPSKTIEGANDLVRFDAAGKADVLVPAEKLVPPPVTMFSIRIP